MCVSSFFLISLTSYFLVVLLKKLKYLFLKKKIFGIKIKGILTYPNVKNC